MAEVPGHGSFIGHQQIVTVGQDREGVLVGPVQWWNRSDILIDRLQVLIQDLELV